MAVGRYVAENNFVTCYRYCVFLARNQKSIQIFAAVPPLEFDCIDITEKLLKTSRANYFLLVIVDRDSKLNGTVRSKRLRRSPYCWLLIYVSSKRLLADIITQFTARLFQHVCKTLDVENSLTVVYSLQHNGSTDRFKRTLIQAVRRFVA